MADAIPLVVNTMGWSKGLGADLNSQITSLVSPTHVFDFAAFDHPDRTGGYVYVEPTVPYGGTTGAEVRYILEPMSSSLSTLFTAADNRSLNILSYFHAVFPTTNEDSRNVMACKWTNTPLISRAPYEINWRTALSGGLILSAPGSEDIVPGEVAHVLPGAIVALTALAPGVEHDIPTYVPQDVARTSTSSTPALGYVQGREPPAPLSSHCLGLALIRGVSLPAEQAQPRNPPSHSSSNAHHPSATDTTTTLTGLVPIPTAMRSAVAQLVTPLPPAMLGSAHHAVKGALELPIWGMLDPSGQDGIAGWPTSRVPYLRWSGRREEEAHGTERRRVRRNLMRKAHA
jgi:polynucleotide 5'-hydroxyl-kinase GRC3/NOL9